MRLRLAAILLMSAVALSGCKQTAEAPKPKIEARHGKTTWWIHLSCPFGWKTDATWRPVTGDSVVDAAHFINDAQRAKCVSGTEGKGDNQPIEEASDDR